MGNKWEDFVARCPDCKSDLDKLFKHKGPCERCRGRGIILVDVRVEDLKEYSDWLRKQETNAIQGILDLAEEGRWCPNCHADMRGMPHHFCSECRQSVGIADEVPSPFIDAVRKVAEKHGCRHSPKVERLNCDQEVAGSNPADGSSSQSNGSTGRSEGEINTRAGDEILNPPPARPDQTVEIDEERLKEWATGEKKKAVK